MFFHYGSALTGDLWKIQSPTFVEHIFLSHCAELQKIKFANFLPEAKT